MGLVAIVLSALGFAQVGIRAGSIAAALMRIATVACGGAMSTTNFIGSIVAALQSIAMTP